jgi:hypothetical protein
MHDLNAGFFELFGYVHARSTIEFHFIAHLSLKFYRVIIEASVAGLKT